MIAGLEVLGTLLEDFYSAGFTAEKAQAVLGRFPRPLETTSDGRSILLEPRHPWKIKSAELQRYERSPGDFFLAGLTVCFRLPIPLELEKLQATFGEFERRARILPQDPVAYQFSVTGRDFTGYLIFEAIRESETRPKKHVHTIRMCRLPHYDASFDAQPQQSADCQ